jgi:hypothetical protein
MMRVNRRDGKWGRFGRLVGGAFALLTLVGVLGACGGQMVPPDNGVCNPGREWVSPYQDDNGDWHTGYCRDMR